ncbi:hypothetical protein QPM17_14385 [Marinobacter sp. TBZ242]|uniref:Uncharacterized protein n=1 Tax=Marinobacter azerbaijanicus TaxID=3050455 RepID=A0ABT7IGT8_9GAMM|nr:hypothetical protein [Marinobacter sp. TBZ242]MDL0432329.1 hypothetical protein [Marinobacter sp. TBZ242]
MPDMPSIKPRLAYWRDQFTVLSVQRLEVSRTGEKVFRLFLFCKGRQIPVFLREAKVPCSGAPLPGERIAAQLRILNYPQQPHMMVQSMERI